MLEEVRLLNVSSEFEFGEEIAERGGDEVVAVLR